MQYIQIVATVLVIVFTVVLFSFATTGNWHRKNERLKVRREYRAYRDWRKRILNGRERRKYLYSDEMYLLKLDKNAFRRRLVSIATQRFPTWCHLEVVAYQNYLEDLKKKGYVKHEVVELDEEKHTTLSTGVEYVMQ